MPANPGEIDVRTLLALAERAADAASYERVLELYAAAREAGIAGADVLGWARLLREAGYFDEAARLAPPPNREDEPDGSPNDDVLDFEPGGREVTRPLVPEERVQIFARWFSGRGDLYARQWFDARRDRSGYWPVREPLSAAVIEQHLLGRVTVGQYVLHPDNTVSFAALDLDPTAAALEELRLENEGEGPLRLEAMREYAARLRSTAAQMGLAPYLEDTGGVGLHLWLLFVPRLPADRARSVLRDILWRAGPQPPAVAVELFPKQDQLGGKGLGNLIKLPLGAHQATLRRSVFLDDHLQPLDDGEALAALRPCDPHAVAAVLARRVVDLAAARAATTKSEALPPAPSPPTGPTPRALAEALAAIAPGRDTKQATDRLVAGCSVVREIARRAAEERFLTPDAARALLYTVGLIGRENPHIEAMFAQAGVSRKELERVRLGLQGPIGCRRLRELFPSFADGCRCPAPPRGGYATPALFALNQAPALDRRPPPSPIGAEFIVPDGMSGDLERRLARVEQLLEQLASQERDSRHRREDREDE